jgi:hypothetical protein
MIWLLKVRFGIIDNTPHSISIDQMNKVTDFGKMPDGRQVKRYTISNKNGLMVGVINYGGIITNLIVPDKNGEFDQWFSLCLFY